LTKPSGDDGDAHLVDHELGPGSLGRTTTRSLDGHDPSAAEQLATPDAPWLLSLQGVGETSLPEVALGADGLGACDVEDVVGEEQRREGAVAVGAARRRPGQWIEVGRCDGKVSMGKVSMMMTRDCSCGSGCG
jgi:hypothetical protein